MEDKDDNDDNPPPPPGMHPDTYELFEDYTKNLSSSQRKIVLSLKDYKLCAHMKEYKKGTKPSNIIVWCIRFLETEFCSPIGFMFYTDMKKKYPKTVSNMAEMHRQLICDLNSLNLTIICSISPPDVLFIDVLDIFTHKFDSKRFSSEPIVYSVPSVGDILHLYDLYLLMESLQKTLKGHIGGYYLTYEQNTGLRRCHASWSDVLSIMTSTIYKSSFFIPDQKDPASNIFNLSFYFILKQAENLTMTPTMNDTIHLIETISPMVESILQLRSVSPSDLEDIYDSLEDVRLVLSSMVFDAYDQLSVAVYNFDVSDPPRPPITLRVPELPYSQSRYSSDIDRRIKEVTRNFFSDNPERAVIKTGDYGSSEYKEFVNHMTYRSTRQVSADGGKTMKSKRKEYTEETLKNIKAHFKRNLRYLYRINGKDKSKEGESSDPKIIIDPLGPSLENVEEEQEESNTDMPQEEEEEVKEAKLKRQRKKMFDSLPRKEKKKISKMQKKKGKSKQRSKYKKNKSSSSAASVSKSSTSVTSAPKPLASAASSLESSTSAAFASKSWVSDTTDSNPSTSGNSNSKQSSVASSSKSSTSVTAASEPSTSATEQEKSHHSSNRHKLYMNPRKFNTLLQQLPELAMHEPAPFNCLSTIKAFVKLADILRKNNISNIETKVFFLDDVDYLFTACTGPSNFNAILKIIREDIYCALHHNILENPFFSKMKVYDRMLHIPQVLEITQEMRRINIADPDCR